MGKVPGRMIHSGREHEIRRRAYVAWAGAKRRQEVETPHECVRCGEKKGVHGHHEDYLKPLEVIWLCRLCHEAEHSGGDGPSYPFAGSYWKLGRNITGRKVLMRVRPA